MPRRDRPAKPLTSADLERLALRYVERYATTRAKLAAYLVRKIRERGWEDGAAKPDPAALAEKFADLGYIDDRGFAEARAASMGRRGLGARRIGQALRFDGIGDEDREAIAPVIEADAVASALAFARRRRIGPWARVAAEPKERERQVSAMIRAGHAPALAWKIARMAPGEEPETLLGQD